MKRILLTICLSLAYLPVASAGVTYVSGTLGASFSTADGYFAESEDQFDNATFFTTESALDTGLMAGAAFGYLTDFGGRLEAELGFRRHGVGDLDLSNGNGDFSPSTDASVSAISVMGNFMASSAFDRSFFGHIGIGAGFANLTVSDVPADSATTNGNLDDSEIVAALQILAGIEILSTPQPDGFSSLQIQFRYFLTGDADLEDSRGTSVAADGLQNIELSIGFNYYFPDR